MGYRNEDSIEASVRSLIDQESSEPFEVVVVTSGGDSSASIIKERFPDVRVYDSPERLMPGGARNVGVGMSNAEIIGFLAADCIALPGWVEGRIQAHRSGNPAVASAIVAPENSNLVSKAALYLLFPSRLPGFSAGPAIYAQSFSLSFDAELLGELGPFDGNLRIGEDSLINGRLDKAGITAWFDPRIQTAHPGPSKITELVRDQFRRGVLRSEWMVVNKPAQGRRLQIEQLRSPFLIGGACALLAFKTLPKRARSTVRPAWTGARGNRLTLLMCSPLIALGFLSNQAGWATSLFRTLARKDIDKKDKDKNEDDEIATNAMQCVEATMLRRWASTSGEKVIALTFDDGPGDDTSALLDELARLEVKATFFVLGDQVLKRPGVVKRMVEGGHVVGTHGFHHTPFTEIGSFKLGEEVRMAKDMLSITIGKPVTLVRPPGGHYDTKTIEVLAQLGLTTWLWTIDSQDWASKDAKAISNAVVSEVAPGAVVLLHDGPNDRAATVAALSTIVEEAKARGYRFVTL